MSYNILLTNLVAQVILGNTDPQSFCTDRTVLSPCHNLGPVIPSTELVLG